MKNFFLRKERVLGKSFSVDGHGARDSRDDVIRIFPTQTG